MIISHVKRNEWTEVCRTDSARLMLTNFMPGVRVQEHLHHYCIIGMPFFGEMNELDRADRSFRCRSFDMGLQPVGHRHSNQIGHQGLRSFMLLFDRDFPKRFGIQTEAFARYQFFKNIEAVKLGVQLCSEVFSNRISREGFGDLARRILESIATQQSIDSRPKPFWIKEIMARIENDLQTASPNNQVKQMANAIGLHPDYVSRKFKQAVGLSLCQYRNRCRVGMAARLFANSEKSAAEIAGECRFSDQSHMTRLFNEVLGITPVSLRELSRTE